MRLRSRRQGASGLYVLACVFLFAGIGYLAVSQFRSRRELLNSRFRELTQDVGTKGTTFGYFWGERANDVRHLVESRELRSYFENEALGMSAQYGLRAAFSPWRTSSMAVQAARGPHRLRADRPRGRARRAPGHQRWRAPQ
ncbi:MAG: hypothetical protein IPP07_24935 [Holophagales bacterium]|nr:hypothetical protein [Holophagales bacterium]